MMKHARRSLPIAGIFFLALIVRLVYNLTAGQHYLIEYDASQYYTLAVNVVKYHCYCTAPGSASVGRAPFWPYTMALIFAVSGSTKDLYARVFLSVLGSGTCVLVYLFARDLFTRRIALVTGIIAALYPGLFIYDGWLYSESVYTFFLTAFAYSLYRFQRNEYHLSLSSELNSQNSVRKGWQQLNRFGWPALAGVSLVCASLTRPNGLLLLGVVVIWALILIWRKLVSRSAAVYATLMIAIITFVLIAPWTIRNYRDTHHIIPIATGSGMVLSGVYNDTILQGHDMGMWVPPNEIRPPVANPESLSPSLHWVEGHLSDMPLILGLHFIHTWIPYTSEAGLPFIEFPKLISSEIIWNMIWIVTPLILLLASLGLIFTWKRRKGQLLIVYLILLMTVGQNIVFYGSSRFRAPIEPLLVLLTGGFLWWVMSEKPYFRRIFHMKSIPAEKNLA